MPDAFLPPLLELDELEGSACCGRGVDFPEPGALPEVGFLIVLECEPHVPVVIEEKKRVRHVNNISDKSDKQFNEDI